MPTITLHIPFTPDPDTTTLVIDDLGNPAQSLNDIAAANGTTVEALCDWMSQPEIADRLSRSDDVITWQTRRIASRALPDVARALVYILKDYCRNGGMTHTGAALQTRAHADRNTLLRHAILEARRAETARRAAATLARLMKAPRIGPLNTLAAESVAPAPRNPAPAPAPAPAPTPDPNTAPSTPASPAAQDLLASLAGADLESLLSALAGLSNAPASDTAPQPLEAHQPPAPPHPNTTTPEPPRAAPAPNPTNASHLPPLQPIESTLEPFLNPKSEIPNPQSTSRGPWP